AAGQVGPDRQQVEERAHGVLEAGQRPPGGEGGGGDVGRARAPVQEHVVGGQHHHERRAAGRGGQRQRGARQLFVDQEAVRGRGLGQVRGAPVIGPGGGGHRAAEPLAPVRARPFRLRLR